MGTIEQAQAARTIAARLKGYSDLVKKNSRTIQERMPDIEYAMGGTASFGKVDANLQNASSVLQNVAEELTGVASNLEQFACRLEAS
ncbi:hypothetical protein FACS1894125_2370 [Actinomycetota bacterium]|nr:hypothetical protein FACS1894125_2370 [Actinomycetota bacterium]